MTVLQPDTPTETEAKIVAAAIQCFVRYGARKTSMADIASAAGVSRQTLYDSFDGKDGLIRAAIRFVTDQSLQKVREGVAGLSDFADQLDVYFQHTVIESFELLQTAADMEDLMAGHNAAGKEEIEASHQRHEALMTELLMPYAAPLKSLGLSPEAQAHYLIVVIMNLKYSAQTRADLDGLLATLKTGTLAVLKG